MTETVHFVSAPSVLPDFSPAQENSAVFELRSTVQVRTGTARNRPTKRPVATGPRPHPRRHPTLPLCRFAFLSLTRNCAFNPEALPAKFPDVTAFSVTLGPFGASPYSGRNLKMAPKPVPCPPAGYAIP